MLNLFLKSISVSHSAYDSALCPKELKNSEDIHQRLMKIQNIKKFCFPLIPTLSHDSTSGCHFFKYFSRQGTVKIKMYSLSSIL